MTFLDQDKRQFYLIKKKKKLIARHDLIALLEAQDLYPKIYLIDRDKVVERLAIGSIYELNEIPDTSSNAEVQFYGVIPFSFPQKDSLPFFFVPKYEIEQTIDCTYLYTYHFSNDTDEEHELSLYKPILQPRKSSNQKHITHTPDYQQWKVLVDEALNQIASKQLSKVVLARQSQIEFNENISSYHLLLSLKQKQLNTTVFFFEKIKGDVFLGSTPEKLYTRQGKNLQTEALAGTALKSEKMRLQTATKENQEVSIVEKFIKNQLTQIGLKIVSDANFSIIETPQLLHLYKKISCHLHDYINDHDIISCLHPTPAVGGSPNHFALHFILQNEPFDRRFYAGSIGHLSNSEANFSVSIRSARILKNSLFLYAGAGIVEGSHPELEWQELDHKISQFLEP
jgi:menaquinone-specific isochorismate synthase